MLKLIGGAAVAMLGLRWYSGQQARQQAQARENAMKAISTGVNPVIAGVLAKILTKFPGATVTQTALTNGDVQFSIVTTSGIAHGALIGPDGTVKSQS